jgi:sRNA-binding protein
MHEGIAQLAELYPNCFRQPRQPLKIGIHNDVIALLFLRTLSAIADS